MKFYIVRHGQTLFNVKGLTQGWCDSPLTDIGIQQAKSVSEKLKNINFEYAYSSTSERAMDTLDIILNGRDIPHEAIKSIKEANFGTLEAEPEDYVHNVLKVSYDEMDKYGGETIEQSTNRFKNALFDLSQKHTGNVLLVSHGGVMIGLIKSIDEQLFISWAKQGGHPIPNCCVLVFECENNTLRFIERIV